MTAQNSQPQTVNLQRQLTSRRLYFNTLSQGQSLMSNPLYKNTKAVGYTRLSTNLQATRDDSEKRQAALIREACAAQGWGLLAIYHDVGSAVGKMDTSLRLGLRDAFKLAQSEGAILIVTEPTRLFRNKPEGLKMLRAFGVKVFSVKDNRLLSRKDLGNAFKAGGEFAEAVRIGSSKSALGRNMPSSHLPKAAASSRQSRAKTSEKVAEAIADAFDHDPSLTKLSHKELAQALNDCGIRSGWNRPWNAVSIRDRRKRANEIARLRRELEAEDDHFSVQASPSITLSYSETTQPENTSSAKTNSDTHEKEKEIFATYRDDPRFGIF